MAAGTWVDVSLTVLPGILVWAGGEGVDLRHVLRMEGGTLKGLREYPCSFFLQTTEVVDRQFPAYFFNLKTTAFGHAFGWQVSHGSWHPRFQESLER
jgi:hypothetical protein